MLAMARPGRRGHPELGGPRVPRAGCMGTHAKKPHPRAQSLGSRAFSWCWSPFMVGTAGSTRGWERGQGRDVCVWCRGGRVDRWLVVEVLLRQNCIRLCLQWPLQPPPLLLVPPVLSQSGRGGQGTLSGTCTAPPVRVRAPYPPRHYCFPPTPPSDKQHIPPFSRWRIRCCGVCAGITPIAPPERARGFSRA